jgi:hypothetical protein
MTLKTINGKHYVEWKGINVEFRNLRTAWKFAFIAIGKL